MSVSTFLDGNTPDQLRGLLWLSLSETAHIVTEAFVSDGGGGGSVTFTPAGTIPCRIDPVGQQRLGGVRGGRIDERSTHLVTLPPNTAVDSTQQIAIDGRGTFEVTALREQTREMARMVEVIKT